jgi:hypothetical protein
MQSPQPPSSTAQPAREGGLRVSHLGGERAARAQRIWLLLAIAAIAAGPAWLLLEHAPAAPETSAGADGSSPMAAPVRADTVVAPAAPPAKPIVRPAPLQAPSPAPLTPADDTHLPSLDPNDLAAYIRPGDPEPTGAEVIRALHDAGIHEGLGAFNPPGTVPLMPGIEVPEDFILPPGYVRHYQVTDAGEMLPPVLMFSPDHDWRDGNGRRLPEDRLVPPEMAPPGMPIRPLPLPQPPEG